MTKRNTSPFAIPSKPLWQMSDEELRDILLWSDVQEHYEYKIQVLIERLGRERGHERDDRMMMDMGR